MKTLKQRFDDKYEIITESGCWIWTGSLFSSGYGAIWDNTHKNNRRAHKVSYELYKDTVPDGLLVCHECDTPSCVNPDHLFLGTNQDNTQDMVNKDRGQYGEQHYNTNLSTEDVNEIKKLSIAGDINQTEIGKMFGVGNTTVSMIKLGHNRRKG